MSLRRKIRSLVERHFVVPHLIRRARRATADRPRTSGVLIMGWYGRETTGDKAILASLLHNIAGHFALSDTAQAHLAVEKGDKLGTVIVDCAR